MTPRLLRRALLDGSNPGTFEVPSPDGSRLATELEHDLAVRCDDGDPRRVTDDGTADQPWVVDSLRWHDDGRRVAVLRMDHRGVARLPIVDWLGATERIDWHVYARAGATISQYELWVVDVESGERQRIDIEGGRDLVVLPLRWRRSADELLVVVWDRCWRWVRLLAASPADGTTRVVLEESSPTNVAGYGAVGGPVSAANVTPSGDRVVTISERDGWGHLFLREIDSGEEVRLTSGELAVRAVAAVDEAEGVVFFTANTDPLRPYDTHVCRVAFDGSELAVLTEEQGRHAPRFAPDLQTFEDTHSSVNRPTRTDVRNREGSLVSTGEPVAVPEGWLVPEPMTFVAADGTTELHGVVYTPPVLDPARRYPLVDVIYGGPQLVVHPRDFEQNSWGLLAQRLARAGFVAFVVDGRGTPERGKAFQDVGFGAFGAHVVDDHVAVVQQLLDRMPFLDGSRVGITGPSWGGYMTTRAMLTAPETFHVGVARCPVYDGDDHLAIAIEPYMGMRHENPDGYRAMSLLALADRLQGQLLLIHGTSDTNAPVSTTMKMVDAFARAGRDVDVVLLPGETHHFLGPAGANHLDRIERYLVEHLGAGS